MSQFSKESKPLVSFVRVVVAGLPWQMQYVSLVSASFLLSGLQFYALLESIAKNNFINKRSLTKEKKAIKNTGLYNLYRD